jgi:hypothetical protein
LACESDDLKKLTQEEREFVETHVAPSWAVHPLTGGQPWLKWHIA